MRELARGLSHTSFVVHEACDSVLGKVIGKRTVIVAGSTTRSVYENHGWMWACGCWRDKRTGEDDIPVPESNLFL